MKARPTINRAAFMRANAKLCSSVNICFAYRSPYNPQPDRRYQARTLSTSYTAFRFSLADQIKQFLPEDALEEENSLVEVHLPNTCLAAYEAEVSAAERLVQQYFLKEAVSVLLNNLPLDSILAAFQARLMPAAERSPIRLLGVLELAFALYKQGSEALANQVLEEFDRSVSQNSRYFGFIAGLESSATFGTLKSTEMDEYLRNLLNESAPFNFPQVLSDKNVSAWLKAHLMAQLSPLDLKRWLTKYSSHFSKECVCLLAMLCSTTQFKVLCDFMVKDSSDLIPSVVEMMTSKEKFRIISRKLQRHTVDSDIVAEYVVAESMLAGAIRLKQTYDIANICRHFSPSLNRPETKSLLAKALLAAAFAQPKPEDEKDMSGLVSGSNEELHTYLVERVLSPVLSDTAARNTVVARAAQRLHTSHAKNVPGKVLWQLLMSLPGPLSGPANASLARLVIKRPYLEQIRYMSLPITTSSSILHLLKWHISKIIEHRKVNVIAPAVSQAEEDIQLLVVGILLASEKQALEVGKTETLQGASRRVNISSLATVLQDPSERSFSTTIVSLVLADLVKQKQYTVAKQLLNEIGLERIPPSIFNNLLLNLAADQPEDSYQFVVWLVQTNDIRISPRCINKMMRILASSNLSESQLVNRFQSLRQLLITSLRAPVEASTASCLIDTLIKSAYTRGRGSHQRLRWALEVAKQARVPEIEFAEWNKTLSSMQEHSQGFWAGSV